MTTQDVPTYYQTALMKMDAEEVEEAVYAKFWSLYRTEIPLSAQYVKFGLGLLKQNENSNVTSEYVDSARETMSEFCDGRIGKQELYSASTNLGLTVDYEDEGYYGTIEEFEELTGLPRRNALNKEVTALDTVEDEDEIIDIVDDNVNRTVTEFDDACLILATKDDAETTDDLTEDQQTALEVRDNTDEIKLK